MFLLIINNQLIINFLHIQKNTPHTITTKIPLTNIPNRFLDSFKRKTANL